MRTKKTGGPVPVEHQHWLRSLIEQRGHGQAAEQLGISEQTLDRAIGGLDLQPGTRALIGNVIAASRSEALGK